MYKAISESKIFLIMALFVSTTSVLYADRETFVLTPMVGKTSPNSQLISSLTSHKNLSFYSNNLLYSKNIALLENRNLVIKAIELAQLTEESFTDDIDDISGTVETIDGFLNTISVENKVKEIFRSSAILGFTTDIVGGELTTVGFATHALKQVLEDEYIKNLLVKEVSYITNTNYDFFSSLILSSIEISLTYAEVAAGKIVGQTISKANWIATFSQSFSKFVGVPLSIYETGLKSVNIGNYIGGIYAIDNAQNVAMPNRLAASFLYDYVNIFKGDIFAMRNFIQKRYTFKSIKHDTTASTISAWKGNEIGVDFELSDYKPLVHGSRKNINHFFELFFWYTVINNDYIDVVRNNRAEKLNIVDAARISLDYIEDYGGGGNYKFRAVYEISFDSNDTPFKTLRPTVGSRDFTMLYYMPTNLDSNIQKLSLYDFSRSLYPKASVINVNEKISYTINLNAALDERIAKFTNHSEGNQSQTGTIVYREFSPEVTIKGVDSSGDKFEQRKQFGDFYLDYGYSTGMNPDRVSFGQSAFKVFYNLGILNTSDESFFPFNSATSDLFVDALYGYVDNEASRSMSGGIINNLFWDKCETDEICGASRYLKNKLDPVTRKDLAKILVQKYDLNNYPVLRKFDKSGTDWTSDGKALFELKIISGNQTGEMAANTYVSKLELIVIMVRIRNLVVK